MVNGVCLVTSRICVPPPYWRKKKKKERHVQSRSIELCLVWFFKVKSSGSKLVPKLTYRSIRWTLCLGGDIITKYRFLGNVDPSVLPNTARGRRKTNFPTILYLEVCDVTNQFGERSPRGFSTQSSTRSKWLIIGTSRLASDSKLIGNGTHPGFSELSTQQSTRPTGDLFPSVQHVLWHITLLGQCMGNRQLYIGKKKSNNPGYVHEAKNTSPVDDYKHLPALENVGDRNTAL